MIKNEQTLGNPVFEAKATEAIPFVLKLTAVGIGGILLYRAISNRFVKRNEVSAYPQANVSFAQAQARANAIYSSMGWVSNDFDNVKAQIQGLNYNGYIRVYNAFGKRRGTLFAGELDLEQWLQNQFTQEQVNELSFLLNGAFFRQATPVKQSNTVSNAVTNIANELKAIRVTNYNTQKPVFLGI